VTAAEDRAEQGLPPTVEDPAVLARIAAIVAAAQRRDREQEWGR
jgi:hypothetical protein